MSVQTARVDQWLWAVRVARTRAAAAELCRGGHVQVNSTTAKPASPVKIGDRVEAVVHRQQRVLVVKDLRVKRVAAAIAVECYEDHSPPPPDRDSQPVFAVRDRGTGRPTKRDRRQLDRLRGRR